MNEKDLKKVQQKAMDKALQMSARLKKVEVNEFSGYADYIALLDDYVTKMSDNKRRFNLSTATKEELCRLKLYDRDVWLICNMIRPMIKNFVNKVEQKVEQLKKSEEKQQARA